MDDKTYLFLFLGLSAFGYWASSVSQTLREIKDDLKNIKNNRNI